MPGISRLRATPWMIVLQAGFVASQYWRKLPARDRQRLVELIRQARGWPGNLSPRERDELRGLANKLDFKSMGREMLPLAGKARRKR